MKDIIYWLQNIEQLTNQLYAKAAEVFQDDLKLSEFLEKIAEDEAWHFHVMGSAANYIASNPIPAPAISIDKETSEKIFQLLSDIKDGLQDNKFSREEIVLKIIQLELSEWNDLFIYVVNALQKIAPEFKYAATRMQSHIKELEFFMEYVEDKPEELKKIRALQPVWVENILIVDDDTILTTLLKSIISRNGNVSIAHNGEEALELIEGKYHKLIISDIDMPKMDGITMYKEAVRKYPSLQNRFLFITGYVSPHKHLFFEKTGIPWLAKPMEIKELREAAERILLLK